MRFPRLAGLLSVALALACASCAMSSERDADRAEAWTREYLDARCRYHVRCEAQFGGLAAREQLVCHPESWGLVLLERARRVGEAFRFDEGRASRCLAAIEAAPCRVPHLSVVDADLYDCNDAVVGAIEAGETCDPTFFGSCADHGTCVAVESTCGGVCRPRGAWGESCRFGRCTDDTTCVVEDEAVVCRAFDLEPGAACEGRDGCRAIDGWRHACIDGRCAPVPVIAAGEPCGGEVVGACAASAVCGGGACVQRVGAGAACRATWECLDGHWCRSEGEGGVCVAFLFGECQSSDDCTGGAPHCVRVDPVQPARCSADATGMSCRGSPQGPLPFWAPDSCPETHRCPSPGAGGCRPIVAEGAACDDERVCADGTRCVDAGCVPLVGPGEPCDAGVACPLTHQCVGGACAPLPALGEPCDGACFEGGCRDRTCALLPDGEPCSGQRQGFVLQCEGHCAANECTSSFVVGPGEDCGSFIGVCSPDLVCVPEPDDTGTCAVPCGS